MTEQNPETPREPTGSINHVAEDQPERAELGSEADDGAVPANPGPVPAEAEDVSDTGDEIGGLAPDPAPEQVQE